MRSGEKMSAEDVFSRKGIRGRGVPHKAKQQVEGGVG